MQIGKWQLLPITPKQPPQGLLRAEVERGFLESTPPIMPVSRPRNFLHRLKERNRNDGRDWMTSGEWGRLRRFVPSLPRTSERTSGQRTLWNSADTYWHTWVAACLKDATGKGDKAYRAEKKSLYVVWWSLFLLLLTTSASTCLKHSPNHVRRLFLSSVKPP